MCMKFCTLNDLFRVKAMEYSGCTCIELSTMPDEIGYSLPGDWCREESGRMMCEELDRCGTWQCELYDYECPRQEYNTLQIDLRGSAKPDMEGQCSAGAALKAGWAAGAAALFAGFALGIM